MPGFYEHHVPFTMPRPPAGMSPYARTIVLLGRIPAGHHAAVQVDALAWVLEASAHPTLPPVILAGLDLLEVVYPPCEVVR